MEILNMYRIKINFQFVFLFVFLIKFGNLYSQNFSINYQCFYDSAFPKVIPAVMKYSNGVSIFEEKLGEAKDWKENKNDIFTQLGFTNGSVVKIAASEASSIFIKRDFNTQNILFTDYVGSKIYEISDFWTPIQWQITQESKVISNYTCFKAKTVFRGLEWEVWFTSEIPLSIGPWKLYGLPGLILEATSENKKYSYIVTEINFQSDDMIVFPSDKYKKIDIKEMVENRKSIRQSINSHLDRGESSIDLSNLIETMEPKYEWEE